MDETILIVGAGQAGATAASSLRKFGFVGRIAMVGAEASLPYERPPLSKDVLLSESATARDVLVHPENFYGDNAVDLLAGTEVASLDLTARKAQLRDGRSIAYDQCLIATGGRARTVPGLVPGTPRVHYLRSIEDAVRLREAMAQSRSILVIGGGFLGLEIASTAGRMNLRVTVVEGASRVLARAVPPVFSQWLQQRAAASGVALRLDARCESFSTEEHGVSVVLSCGERLSADLVVVAVGLTPNTALAQQTGIAIHDVNGGIRVDAHCRTSAARVFAAGDCTSQHHPHIGTELRLESWQNANEQARIAAAAMAGAGTPPLAAPWFWTDQFGCNVQMLGMPAEGLRYVSRGLAGCDAPDPRFLLIGVDQAGQLAHLIAINSGGELRQLKPLLERRQACDLAAFCDPGNPMRQLVRDALQPSPATPIP